ncbi:MAG TPA: TetR family transcriptional regulator [Aquabacterium sp.]|uniref:TetR/AcrR family transcriptional regulator n=1 Tax=Aquabacterium sp. TaxID=1872578 RepID=UPI002E365961|nr:TetR family transcriptional regulator [Aquabacterium sp.]HEX5372748.1 TetR family transcriptional regulator [Aquabacterium sp.]
MSSSPTPMAPGKRLLMQATARLAARHSSAQTLGLRELAREAGLNHNTFYRHFDSLEDLLQEVVNDFGSELRHGLRQARESAPANEVVSLTVVSWLLDFALAHRDVFIVSMREQYGPPGPLRDAVRQMLTQLQEDMLHELRARQALPPVPDEALQLPLRIITEQTFRLCIAHIEAPEHKAQRLQDAQALFETLMLGTLARQAGLPNGRHPR